MGYTNQEILLDLRIGGMHCEACVRRLTAALHKVAGVAVKGVAVGSAKIAYDPAAVEPGVIEGAIQHQGFTVLSEPGK